MWNSFEKHQQAMEQNRFWTGKDGLCPEALSEKAKELLSSYAGESVSAAKAGVMAFVLENAQVEIGSEDIFVYRLRHGGVMSDFFREMLEKAPDWKDAQKKTAALESAHVIQTSMDFGHIGPDWNYLLEKGISGIIADLESYGDTPYYNQRLTVYRGVRSFFLRIADMSEGLRSPKTAFMAENFRHLADNPPETLAQALQLILVYYVLQMELDTVIIRSLGGLDRMLWPLYRRDLETGRYTQEQLAEIIKYFLWDISCMKVTANMPFYIGGLLENGQDATNPFTLFLLQCYEALDIYDPKIHVMYHDGMDKQVLRQVLEMIRAGKNSFVFMNLGVISKSLEGIGISPADAKKVIVYGCYEPAAEGTEVPCTCGGKVNFAKAIEQVMGSDRVFATFEELYEAVMEQLRSDTVLCMDTIGVYEKQYEHICPSMLMSPTYRHSREQGLDVYAGGAKYNNTSIVGAGLATLVDSLAAVRQVVFEEKSRSYRELREILRNNWTGEEKLRLRIKNNCPKFGNNQMKADELAVDIAARFADWINGRKNGRGGVFRCGVFSVDWRIWMGKTTGATADGRLAGEPLSKNLAASVGQDKQGVTAYLQSVLKIDGTKIPDGYVADVVLHSSAVKGADGMVALESLLVTFMKMGGFAVHFNILTPEALVSAQREPEKYRNLQIRLCGWNVRFVDLDKAHQDEFIKQAENHF